MRTLGRTADDELPAALAERCGALEQSAQILSEMPDGNAKLEAATHYLHPSMIFASDRPHIVTTVLGTCVAVCLWDRVARVGGINHFMLPLWNGKGLASPKFGNIAVPLLIGRMEKYGCKRVNLIAKVFGGKSACDDDGLLNVGARNAEIAEAMLADAGIHISARSVGGPFGRKLIFNTETSEVLMKRHAM